jgi:hypothetical protein
MAGTAGHLASPRPHRLRGRILLGLVLAAIAVTPAAIVLLADDDPTPAPSVRVDEVAVGSLPTDIAFAQGRAWVPSAGSDELVAIADQAHPALAGSYHARSGALRVATDGLSSATTSRPSTRCSGARPPGIGSGSAPTRSTWP